MDYGLWFITSLVYNKLKDEELDILVKIGDYIEIGRQR
jgi:hypothetical protein